MTLQILWNRVLKFNADGPAGLLDRMAWPAAQIESGLIPAIYGVVRWQVINLYQWLFEKYKVSVAKQTLSCELRKMGYRKLSAHPRHHAQTEGAIVAFKKPTRPSG